MKRGENSAFQTQQFILLGLKCSPALVFGFADVAGQRLQAYPFVLYSN